MRWGRRRSSDDSPGLTVQNALYEQDEEAVGGVRSPHPELLLRSLHGDDLFDLNEGEGDVHLVTIGEPSRVDLADFASTGHVASSNACSSRCSFYLSFGQGCLGISRSLRSKCLNPKWILPSSIFLHLVLESHEFGNVRQSETCTLAPPEHVLVKRRPYGSCTTDFLKTVLLKNNPSVVFQPIPFIGYILTPSPSSPYPTPSVGNRNHDQAPTEPTRSNGEGAVLTQSNGEGTAPTQSD
eukprot:8496059-Pyramimonas_sp.AAC.1